MLKQRSKKGQITLEIAMLFAIVGAALLAMQVYMNRGIQGKIKASTDSIGEQYHAGKAEGVIKETSHSQSTEAFSKGVTTSTIHAQSEDVTGNEKLLDLDK